MKASFKRSWQLLIILHSVKTKAYSTSKDWFDVEIMEKINERDKVFKKLKKSCLHDDEDNYKQARNELEKLIRTKKKAYFEIKLTQNIGKSKELCRSLKSLGLKIKPSISNVNCLENDESAIFDVKDTGKNFRAYFSNVAENLVSKLPNASYMVCF